MSTDLPKLPQPLKKMIDTVLAYTPKPAKAKAAAKKRKNTSLRNNQKKKSKY